MEFESYRLKSKQELEELIKEFPKLFSPIWNKKIILVIFDEKSPDNYKNIGINFNYQFAGMSYNYDKITIKCFKKFKKILREKTK